MRVQVRAARRLAVDDARTCEAASGTPGGAALPPARPLVSSHSGGPVRAVRARLLRDGRSQVVLLN